MTHGWKSWTVPCPVLRRRYHDVKANLTNILDHHRRSLSRKRVAPVPRLSNANFCVCSHEIDTPRCIAEHWNRRPNRLISLVCAQKPLSSLNYAPVLCDQRVNLIEVYHQAFGLVYPSTPALTETHLANPISSRFKHGVKRTFQGPFLPNRWRFIS